MYLRKTTSVYRCKCSNDTKSLQRLGGPDFIFSSFPFSVPPTLTTAFLFVGLESTVSSALADDAGDLLITAESCTLESKASVIPCWLRFRCPVPVNSNFSHILRSIQKAKKTHGKLFGLSYSASFVFPPGPLMFRRPSSAPS